MSRGGAKARRRKKRSEQLNVQQGGTSGAIVPAVPTVEAGIVQNTDPPPGTEIPPQEDETSLSSTIKPWLLVAPSWMAKILISIPLVAFMIWVLALVVHYFHDYILAPSTKFVLSNFPVWFSFILNNTWSMIIILGCVALLVISLAIEVHRVGLREALATAIGWSEYVANGVYKLFRLVTEFIWIILRVVSLQILTEGLSQFWEKTVGGIKESWTETK
jgi:hypothetical protein